MSMNRRSFLKGTALAAGSLPLSPLMQSVQAAIAERAAGRDEARLRIVFCIKSNGLWAEMIQPPTLWDRLPFDVKYDEKGRLVNGNHGNIRKLATPAADLRLPNDTPLSIVMESLAPFQDRISILQGINSGFSTYHSGQYQTLGAFQARTRNSIETLGPTIDSLLARAFARPIPHVCLGHDPHSPSGVAYVPTSAAGAGKPLPFYTKPKRAYKELFGVIDKDAARDEYEVQSGILDFFVEDTKRLKANIAGPERAQLDRYLDAFESIKQSRRNVEAMSDQLRKHAPKPPGDVKADATMKVNEGNTGIAIASLLSGLTNVVTLRFDLLGSSSYEGIGGLHGGVGHGQVKNIVKARREICAFQFGQIARIAAALQSIPEGDGTMLDNTLFVYTSDNGETHHSGGVNYPVLLLGDLGGRLKTRRYFAPGNAEKIDRAKSEYTRLGDLWATILTASGQPFEQFGIPVNGIPHRPIGSLLT
jgi:hypothetical protein